MTPTMVVGRGVALLGQRGGVLGRCMKVLTFVGRVFLSEAVRSLYGACARLVAPQLVKKCPSCAALVAAHDDYEHLDTRSLSTMSTAKNL